MVVVDGASPDNTHEVMQRYVSRYPEVRYYREKENSGVDGDYDKAVGYARGEFCWLMTDDDLLCPDAIERVLASIDEDLDLIVVNAEVRDGKLSKTLHETLINIPEDRRFSSVDVEDFFELAAQGLSFIGCVVVRRETWLSRDRASYYGSLFVHVGVIFQSPPLARALVIRKPLIFIRFGNAMWTHRSFEIWMFKWPNLLWSFDGISTEAKIAVTPREPWRKISNLIRYRALGGFGMTEYRKFLAGQSGLFFRIAAFLVVLVPIFFYRALKYLLNFLGLSKVVKSRMGLTQ